MMTLMKEERDSNANQFNAIASLIQQDSSKTAGRFNALEKRMEQWETKAENINSYVTQLSNNMSENQAKSSGSIPSNTVMNPKSLNVIALRSGKQVRFKPQEEDEICEEDDESEPVPPPKEKSKRSESVREEELLKERKQASKSKGTTLESSNDQAKDGESSQQAGKGEEVSIHDLPFPNSYLMSKRLKEKQHEKEIIDLFGKVEVNVPLLDLVKRVPAYAKYLKDLCTSKRKFRPNERVQVSSNVSALFKPQIPVKCQDPGSFTVPCTLGKVTIGRALLDLGAAINVMPKSVYEALGVKSIKATSVVLQLADRSFRHPVGIIEDILVQVKGLVFPADFYVLDMSTEVVQDTSLILGRPFLRTASTMISMKEGKITMEVGDQRVSFNMYEAMKHPNEDYSLLGVNMIDLIEENACHKYESQEDSLNSGLHSLDFGKRSSVHISGKQEGLATTTYREPDLTPEERGSDLFSLELHKLTPSVVKPPELELKPLPPTLKYAFLESDERLPVIIFSTLSHTEEERLMNVLREHKRAIGWTLADIPGISPAICTHRILLSEGSKSML
ncbi:hypothetical protein K2173_005114 [Erythroxylum novogranatense]|uniref:Aspartic peptidase DDI1-type domain-containing protein n=1 Tax=Erythroxylum novogranatense TaxID=1862640 RepID=A0AAV8TBH6_9ROSI|nr:hypothetical protein K2173_005114 [Erythroxylum novogranatense]